jgi:hypothetical protein
VKVLLIANALDIFQALVPGGADNVLLAEYTNSATMFVEGLMDLKLSEPTKT